MRRWLGILFVLSTILSAAPAETRWRVVKDHWSASDEAGFARFVQGIGESQCSSSQSCLRDGANPFRLSDQRFLDIDTDCAKWPYLLRAYYAWKNGLPFSFVDAIASNGDERHGAGNRPVSRKAFLDHGEGISGPAAVREVIDTVSSATYRTDAAHEGRVPSDFYAPRIAPGSIRPGTVIYDTNAHTGIIYKIDADGRIYYMDAHPDFTITRSVYGGQFGQSPARLGGGLKNWRPQRLVDAHDDGKGHLLGGHIVLSTNDQIADFSLVQYEGTEPGASPPRFVYDGEAMGLYPYVRTAMAGGHSRYNPLHELRIGLRGLCSDLKDRAAAVNLAISEKVQELPHPVRLPTNIFDSKDEDWEKYATPARDSRLRAKFAELYAETAVITALWVKRDPRVIYDGIDLKADLLAIYEAETTACDLTYLNSAKRPVPLNLQAVLGRLYALSFDPYDCVELRWGAAAQERATCSNGDKKLRWYAAEQRLRDMPGRETHIAFGLDTLERMNSDFSTPLTDLRSLIEHLPPRAPLAPMAPVGR